ncbi:MAG TPA: hypothetical protein VMV77_19600 [Bacteroidales bacterium]|nr:hypothetical protein [Bacteroidales bacterium]
MGQNEISEYKIVDKIKLPGEGFWDYLSVDEAGARLFLSHGTIDDTPGVHGIALAPDLNKAFISVGSNASVKVINFSTLASIADIKITGEGPDAIMYDKFSGKPEFPVSDGKGKVFVNIEDKSLISVIDVNSMKVEKSWPIAPGEEASGLALDNETHRLFSVCSNKLMVIIDALDEHIVSTLPIGDGCDGVKFDPGMKRAFSSNGEGTMTVVQEIDKDNYQVIANVTTAPGARTLALDTNTHHIYMPTAEMNPSPEPTADNPRPRRSIKPGSFFVMDIVQVKN